MNRNIFMFGNAFIGLLALCLQISALAVSEASYAPDLVCTGIWGGIFLVMLAGMLKMKALNTTNAIMAMSVYAALTGITLIGLHSWSINLYQPLIADCKNYIFNYNTGLCGRVAIDSLLIISGIMAFVLNTLMAAKASSLASQ